MTDPFDSIDPQVRALVYAIGAVLILGIIPAASDYAVPVGCFIIVVWLLKYRREGTS